VCATYCKIVEIGTTFRLNGCLCLHNNVNIKIGIIDKNRNNVQIILAFVLILEYSIGTL